MMLSLMSGPQREVTLKVAKLTLSSDEESGSDWENDMNDEADETEYLTGFIEQKNVLPVNKRLIKIFELQQKKLDERKKLLKRLQEEKVKRKSVKLEKYEVTGGDTEIEMLQNEAS